MVPRRPPMPDNAKKFIRDYGKMQHIHARRAIANRHSSYMPEGLLHYSVGNALRFRGPNGLAESLPQYSMGQRPTLGDTQGLAESLSHSVCLGIPRALCESPSGKPLSFLYVGRCPTL